MESGFLNGREINTVHYDPAKIGPEKMIEALKNAGTYLGVAENE